VTGDAYNPPQERCARAQPFAAGLGRGNDFVDLSVNRSKLLFERSHALINVRLGCASLRFDSAVIISIY
jgi:hypothetical protein